MIILANFPPGLGRKNVNTAERCWHLDHGAVGRGAKRGRAGAGGRGSFMCLGDVPYSGAGGETRGQLCQVTQ